ncbi:MAG TPA: 16S rRNA (uracil(1498)-N(3))-methyltransferase [Bacteroidia bacterium]|nr:16S rRNA (uracil(1498)-N(3))-methyltransferase [Bacteroidia bacterium]
MHFFYQPDLSGEFIYLDEDESKHAIRVLRMTIGEQVEIVDGKGIRAVAEVTKDHPKRCELRIVSRKTEESPRNYYLHIAVAPTKNIERIEWFVEKAVEIGIDEISFLDCEHSERTVVKMERMEKVAVAAMKQSQQSRVPVIHAMKPFAEFVAESKSDVRLIAHCEEGAKNPVQKAIAGIKSILVLIGPEGDFSNEEIKLAVERGFVPTSLGETRLRTETAALYTVMAAAIVTA